MRAGVTCGAPSLGSGYDTVIQAKSALYREMVDLDTPRDDKVAKLVRSWFADKESA